MEAAKLGQKKKKLQYDEEVLTLSCGGFSDEVCRKLSVKYFLQIETGSDVWGHVTNWMQETIKFREKYKQTFLTANKHKHTQT